MVERGGTENLEKNFFYTDFFCNFADKKKSVPAIVLKKAAIKTVSTAILLSGKKQNNQTKKLTIQ